MSSDLERLARMKARQAKLAEKEQQDAALRRAAEIKIRKAEKALSTRRAMLVGETIRDAKLTHEEKAIICRVISRRTDRPSDWDKISDFTIAVVPAAHEPVSLRPALAEFSRAGK
jgi:hypothetical protein